MDALPGVLSEIAEIAGVEAALGLALLCGGSEIHIPRPARLTPDHRLTAGLGAGGAAAVARYFAGEKLYIPRARRALARHLAARRVGSAEIAARLGISVRTARRYSAGIQGDRP